MSLRRILNVAWVLACEGLEEDGIVDLRKWLDSAPRTPQEDEKEKRRRQARETKQGIAGLSQAFKLGS